MKLIESEVHSIKRAFIETFEDGKIYLFGSRVDDSKRGGDIDLLIVSDTLTKKDLRLIRIDFFKHFGEQKIDIVLDNGEFKNPFVQHIFQKAILL